MVCYTIAIDVVGGRLAALLGLWKVSSFPGALANAHQMVLKPLWDQAVMGFLIAPVVESLVIIAIIELLRRLKSSPSTGIAVATLLFSALHSVTIPIWGVICIPGFFIQSVSYVYWRRISFWAGLQTIVIIHALTNLAPFLYTLEHRH
jgi:hypothetical protein